MFLCWLFSTGGSYHLPDGERSDQAALPEQPGRALEFKKARGLLQRLNTFLQTDYIEVY